MSIISSVSSNQVLETVLWNIASVRAFWNQMTVSPTPSSTCLNGWGRKREQRRLDVEPQCCTTFRNRVERPHLPGNHLTLQQCFLQIAHHRETRHSLLALQPVKLQGLVTVHTVMTVSTISVPALSSRSSLCQMCPSGLGTITDVLPVHVSITRRIAIYRNHVHCVTSVCSTWSQHQQEAD